MSDVTDVMFMSFYSQWSIVTVESNLGNEGTSFQSA